jgi:SM-20-related protein
MNFEKLINDLLDKGWHIDVNFLPMDYCQSIIDEMESIKFSKAQIGSGLNKTLDQNIRGDFIHWVDDKDCSLLQKEYFLKTQEIQSRINRELYLNLKEFEFHLAYYPIDSFYKKHTDQFKGNNARTVTLISYLNSPTGGELVLYKKENPDEIDAIISPKQGMMICFLSDQLYHEVLPTKTKRYSITGWFKNKI